MKDVAREFGEALRQIGRRCAGLPELDQRSPDEIIGFDEAGLPGRLEGRHVVPGAGEFDSGRADGSVKAEAIFRATSRAGKWRRRASRYR